MADEMIQKALVHRAKLRGNIEAMKREMADVEETIKVRLLETKKAEYLKIDWPPLLRDH